MRRAKRRPGGTGGPVRNQGAGDPRTGGDRRGEGDTWEQETNGSGLYLLDTVNSDY